MTSYACRGTSQEARLLPLVQEARDLAEERGLLGDPDASGEDLEAEVDDVGALLAQVLGTNFLESELTGCCGEKESACQDLESSERPTWVANASRTPTSDVPKGLNLPDQTWTNKRLSFNPQNRLATKAQRKEVLRRDGWKVFD
jgi:hypothetical protein